MQTELLRNPYVVYVRSIVLLRGGTIRVDSFDLSELFSRQVHTMLVDCFLELPHFYEAISLGVNVGQCSEDVLPLVSDL